MLSPGKYHEKVPRTLRENLLYRKKVLKACRLHPEMRRAMVEICRRDCLYYINVFGWQHNPKKGPGKRVGPFITWPFQEKRIRDLLDSIDGQYPLIWEKSRDVGATWQALFVGNWACAFHDHTDGLMLSRDEDAVGRAEDRSSLFWKLEFMNEKVPEWLTGPVRKRKMGMVYDRSQSTVFGEANTEKAGVSGRASWALIDEFGQFAKGEEIYERTADTCSARWFVGTHKDTGSMFYDLCFAERYKGIKHLLSHWSEHPDKNRGLYRFDDEKNRIEVLDKTYPFPADYCFVMDGTPEGGPFPCVRSPWYDKECRERTERGVAMDLDINPKGATTAVFDLVTIRTLKRTVATPPTLWNLKYDPITGKPLELERAMDGLVKLWVIPKNATRMPPMRCGGGIDLSFGTGATPTCLSIFNATTGAKVLEYINAKIDPTTFAGLCSAIGWLFQDYEGQPCLLCWEMQGPGIPFSRKIIELGYTRYHCMEDEDALGRPLKAKMTPGWNPTTKETMALLTNYKVDLEGRLCTNYSWEALDECERWIYSKTGVEYRHRGARAKDDPMQAKVHHGDTTIADALAWKMVKRLGLSSTPESDPQEIIVGSRRWRESLHERESELVESRWY